ncbi:MAG TPA: peptide chain release factor 1 [Nitriliruptorales bacterium]
MFDRLDAVVEQFRELEAQLADPGIHEGGQFGEIAKKHAALTEIVHTYQAYQEAQADLQVAREMAAEARGADRDLMRDEAADLERRVGGLEEHLKLLLLPKDPNDDKDVIVEIRAGAGGDEAGLFAGELFEMYARYAGRQGWRTDVLSRSDQGIGGVKEVVFEVVGQGAFSRLKHESGVHRVQRVPSTESQGRIHTSTASVAVLPAAGEVDVEVDATDLRVDVFRSSGPGGQSVNTTDSAVRITHVPTGLVVTCQDEKSQHQNRDKAMRILRSRLLQAEQERQAQARADQRKGQIGTGDRSEKIRTYNFPENRVTDHRIGLKIHDVPGILAGDLDELVQGLTQAERAAQLADDGDEGPQ